MARLFQEFPEVMMVRRIGCALVCTLALGTLAHAESVSGRINPNRDKLFVFRASSFNQAVITAMWKEAGTDCDLFVFVLDDNQEALPLGVGLSSTENMERLEVGVGAGIDIYILVSIFSGEATSFQLNAQSTQTDSLGAARGPSLHELSEADPRISTARRALWRLLAAVKPAS